MAKKSTIIVLFLLALSPTLVGQTGWIIVPAMAFNGKHGTETFVKEEFSPHYSYLYMQSGTHMYAPVYFPESAQGKKVKRLTVKMYDMDDTVNGFIDVWLTKHL